jgi:hypothetical protein
MVDQEIGMLGQGLREVSEFAKILAAEQEKLVENVITAHTVSQTATAGSAEVQTLIKLQMIILIAPNFIGRDNTPVTIPRLAVG